MKRWQGIIGVEGVWSVDGRKALPEAFTWADLPIPLQDNGNRPAGQFANIGTVETIERVPGAGPGEFVLIATGTVEGALPADLAPCIAADSMVNDFLEPDDENPLHRIIATSARIRAVYFGVPAWPACIAEEMS